MANTLVYFTTPEEEDEKMNIEQTTIDTQMAAVHAMPDGLTPEELITQVTEGKPAQGTLVQTEDDIGGEVV